MCAFSPAAVEALFGPLAIERGIFVFHVTREHLTGEPATFGNRGQLGRDPGHECLRVQTRFVVEFVVETLQETQQ